MDRECLHFPTKIIEVDWITGLMYLRLVWYGFYKGAVCDELSLLFQELRVMHIMLINSPRRGPS